MINPAVTSHRQTWIAVIAFSALLCGVLAWGIDTALVNSDLQNEFEAKTRTMDRLRQSVPLQARGAVQFVQSDTIIGAPTETLAASELHRRVLTFLDDAGGSVRSIQSEATNDTTGDGLKRLNAQVNFESSTDVLQKILFELETSVPFIFVDSLVIQRVAPSASGPIAGERLNVALVASSYWKPAVPVKH